MYHPDRIIIQMIHLSSIRIHIRSLLLARTKLGLKTINVPLSSHPT